MAGGAVPIKVQVCTEDAGVEENGFGRQCRGDGAWRVRIAREVLGEHGYADGCEGCRYKKANLRDHLAHTEECHMRVTELAENAAGG